MRSVPLLAAIASGLGAGLFFTSAPHAPAAWGMSRDVAYLLMNALGVWSLICSMAFAACIMPAKE